MKLFVWASPYRVPYGMSALFAIAETETEAREIAKAAPRYSYVEYGDGIGALDPQELGAPTRVVDLPCAEWHEWSE